MASINRALGVALLLVFVQGTISCKEDQSLLNGDINSEENGGTDATSRVIFTSDTGSEILDLKISPRGDLWASTTGAETLFKFTATGTSTMGNAIKREADGTCDDQMISGGWTFDFDRNGNVFVPGRANSCASGYVDMIAKLETNLALTNSSNPLPAAINYLDIGRDGVFYAATAGESIYSIDSSGTANLLYMYSYGNSIRQIAADSSGQIYIINGGYIEKLINGAPQRLDVPLTFRSITFDVHDDLYGVVENENLIVKITSSGVVHVVAQNLLNSSTYGGNNIAVNSDGKIFVSDFEPGTQGERIVREITR